MLVNFDGAAICISRRSILREFLSDFSAFLLSFSFSCYICLFHEVRSTINKLMMTSSHFSVGKTLFLIICIALVFQSISSTEVELRRSLFQKRSYDQKVCPEEGITKVHTNLILLQIESVNEKAQVNYQKCLLNLYFLINLFSHVSFRLSPAIFS